MSLRQFPTRHPLLWTGLCFALVSFPAWVQSIWGLWSSEPLVPLVLDKLRKVELPVFSAYWVTIPLGLAMFGWLIYERRFKLESTDTRSISEPTFIPLRDAARTLYEAARRDGALLATAAERMSGSKDGRITVGSPNDILDFMANHIARHIFVFGKKAPSSLFEQIKNEERGHARFTDGAMVLRDIMYDQSIFWTDLAVRADEFNSFFNDMKILETPRSEAEMNFAKGFDRATFARNPNSKAAKVRLSQLRSEGVVIRNAGAALIFASHLEEWAKRIADWMKETIDAVKVIDEADGEWFAVLGEVPKARVPIPNLQLGGQADREMFVKLFREHDFRLARLDQLLKKYGIGA
jgi:hypothetical protein